MSRHTGPERRHRRHYMAAVVLGTALSALGLPQNLVAEQFSEPGTKVMADISRYCTACWRNARLPADHWQDCTQDVFSRLLRSIPAESWHRVFKLETAERQEFVRAIDAVKKRTQRRLKKARTLVGVVADPTTGDNRHRVEQREVVEKAAGEVLSPRQQKILQMSFEGWAVQDMASELEMSPERVSDEKYKAIRKLRQHLQVG